MTTMQTPTGATVTDGLFAIASAIEALATAVTRVSHGDANGPTGLEMLSIAIAGEGAIGHDSLAGAVRSASMDIANVIEEAMP